MTANSIKSSKAFSVFKDSAICIVVLTAATLAGYAFKAFQLADADIIMLYIIAVLVISIFTSKMYFCLISSLVGVCFSTASSPILSFLFQFTMQAILSHL